MKVTCMVKNRFLERKEAEIRDSSSLLSNFSQGSMLVVPFVLHQYTQYVSMILVKNACPSLGCVQMVHPRVIPVRLNISYKCRSK